MPINDHSSYHIIIGINIIIALCAAALLTVPAGSP